MATRSRIGIELNDGSILSVYHHWNGYPSWLGRILKSHYNTKEKVAELIDSGDMSICWTDKVWGKDRTDGKKYGPETYADRGEDCPPRLDKDHGTYLTNDVEEYSYLFTTQEEWLCYDTCHWHETYLESVEIPNGALEV